MLVMSCRPKKRKRSKTSPRPSFVDRFLDRRQFVTGTLATLAGGWLFLLSGRIPELLPERTVLVPVQPQPIPITPHSGVLVASGTTPNVSIHATATTTNTNCDLQSCGTHQLFQSPFSPAP